MSTKTKKLLIVISKDIIRRNIFDTQFWDVLIENKKGLRITLVVEQGREAWFRQRVPTEVEVIGYKRQLHHGWSKFVNFLVRTAGNTHSMRTYRNRAYKRGQSVFITYATKAFIANTVGSTTWYQNFIRSLVQKLHTTNSIQEIFDTHKPTHVFAPSLIDNDFDVLFSIEARRRKVPIVGMVRSWDNLNNHGLLALVPDLFLLQNKWLKEAGEKFQSINFHKTKYFITGLPHYDTYYKLKERLKTSREEFFASLNINPDKKIILLGGSDFYYSEYALPKLLNDAIETGQIKQPSHIIFRPHPASPFKLEDYDLERLEHVTLDDAFSGKTLFSDQEKFNNLLCHSDIIMNICSTLSIDAAVIDKPAIAINFDDPSLKLSYYEQVGRLYDQFDHYERLVETGAISTPRSAGELVDAINQYLTNPKKDHGGRQQAVQEFVSPFDGRAGERVAEKLLAAIGNQN